MGFGCLARIIQYGLGFFVFSYKDLIDADKKVGRNSSVPNATTSYLKLLNDHKDKGKLPDHKVIQTLLEKSITTLTPEEYHLLRCVIQDIWCLQRGAPFPDARERNPMPRLGPSAGSIRTWRELQEENEAWDDGHIPQGRVVKTPPMTDKQRFVASFLSSDENSDEDAFENTSSSSSSTRKTKFATSSISRETPKVRKI